MNALHAVILGIVEGLTEFLPVSSTGHLLLAERLMGLQQTEFTKTFDIAIQLGAILAVVALYWRSFLDVPTLKRVLVAFVPTGVIGLLLYKVIKEYLLSSEVIVLWALAVGGAALITFELWYAQRASQGMATPAGGAAKDIAGISYKQAAVIGTVQALAVIPGVSRSAATIVGGLAQGIDRETVVRFSFLLAVPTMAAATGLDLLKSAGTFASADFGLLAIGMGVSFVVALVAIRYFLKFVRTSTFVPFGVYRIAVAAAFWLLVLN